MFPSSSNIGIDTCTGCTLVRLQPRPAPPCHPPSLMIHSLYMPWSTGTCVPLHTPLRDPLQRCGQRGREYFVRVPTPFDSRTGQQRPLAARAGIGVDDPREKTSRLLLAITNPPPYSRRLVPGNPSPARTQAQAQADRHKAYQHSVKRRESIRDFSSIHHLSSLANWMHGSLVLSLKPPTSLVHTHYPSLTSRAHPLSPWHSRHIISQDR